MNFNDYFTILMKFKENPFVDISISKRELEYEILKIWNSLLLKYGISEDKFKISNYYRDNNSSCFSIDLTFENTQNTSYYKSIGLFAGMTSELSDKLRKEIIEKEKILKRTLK